MRKCLKCNEVVGGASKICRKCGSILEEIVEGAPSPPPAAPPEAGAGGELDDSVAGWLSRAEATPAAPPPLPPPTPVEWLRSLEAAPAEQDSAGATPWACPKCSETVEADFDVCWKCGTARDGTEDPGFTAADADAGTAGDEIRLPRSDAAPDEGRAEQGYEELADLLNSTASRCAKCGSPQVVRGARVADQGEYSNGRLQVVIFGDPGAILFKDRLYADLRATICGQCGYVELYAVNPSGLYQHYLKSRGG